MNREIAIPGGAGVYPLAGDVASRAGNSQVRVTGLQGVPVAQASLQGGEYLEYDPGSHGWVPTLRATIQVNGKTVSDDNIIIVNLPHLITVNGAGKVTNAVRKPFSLKAVQEALQNSKGSIQDALQSSLQNIQSDWHGAVRDLFDQVAKEADVEPKPAESLRDVAANTAAAVKAKASALYKQLDQAIGGTRFQTYDEQLSNVRRALKNSAGIDPDADGRLVERINDLEDAKAAALDQAKAAGVDPKLIEQANAAWRQASALEDLSKHIQASTSGLRGDLAQGAKAAPEALSPAKLATRANRLYDTGRLQQALGESQADDLLRHIETTKQAAQDAAENAARQSEAATAKAAQQTAAVRRNQTIATTAAGGIGAGTAWAWLKHLLGE